MLLEHTVEAVGQVYQYGERFLYSPSDNCKKQAEKEVVDEEM